jgi:RNA polymerase subunit RPABC4/transcription elongation factor Spt4
MGESRRRRLIRNHLGVKIGQAASCTACRSGVVILPGHDVPMPCPHCQEEALAKWLGLHPIIEADLKAQAEAEFTKERKRLDRKYWSDQ